MAYFNAYAWIMFIHVQICVLSDFIMSGKIVTFSFAQRSIYEEDSQCILVHLGRQAAIKSSAL
jgi:hypothetical protein